MQRRNTTPSSESSSDPCIDVVEACCCKGNPGARATAQGWLADAFHAASPAHLGLAGGLLVLLLCTACLRGGQHRGPKTGEVAALRRELTELWARLDDMQAEQQGRQQWRDFRRA